MKGEELTIRDQVELDNLHEAPLARPNSQDSKQQRDTEVTCDDLPVVPLVKDDRVGRKVVSKLGVGFLAGSVPDEVPGGQREVRPALVGIWDTQERVRTSGNRRAAGR